MAHKNIGMEMLRRIIADMGELATVASEPMMEGRLLHMILTPSPKASVLKRANDEKKKTKETETKDQPADDKQETNLSKEE